jgi:cytochrome c-type biogenesis protein CcmH/NrfG
LSDDTVAAYRQVTALDADQPEALYVLGLAARQHGHLDEGAALWRRLLARMPADSPDAAEIRKQLDAPAPSSSAPG